MKSNRIRGLCQLGFANVFCSLMFGAFSSPVVAQITPDATLPINSVVTWNGNTFTITGGTPAGSNLFHSFSAFSLPSGTAFFNNAANITNIFSRVTGSSISNINGTLQTNGNANLFFINPNGIILGLNATLNIGGSFIASTADSIVFADRTVFNAAPATQTKPLLTVSVPIGLQFRGNQGGIKVQGDGQGLRRTSDPIDTTTGLHVPSNQTLALVGGDVNLQGATLKTAGGRIELGSVAGSGLVMVTPIAKGWALGYQAAPTFGDIQLTQQAAVDASGEGGGDIQVQARRLTLLGGSLIEASTLGAGTPGSLDVVASESVEVIEKSSITSQVREGGKGNGGDVTISTERLILQGGAQVTTGTFGEGSSGKLQVDARESVELTGVSADPDSAPSGLTTQAGNPPPNSGAGAKGGAGNLRINTRRLIIRDGAGISTATFTEESAGDLQVVATQSVEVSGMGLRSPSGLTSGTSTTASAGKVTVTTGQLTVRDGGQIYLSSSGSGKAGTLDLKADSIRLDNKARISVNTSGSGGDINLNSPLVVLLRDSDITTNAKGSNNPGGNISINTTNLVAIPKEDSDITANSEDSRGGTVTINASGGIFGLKFRDQDYPNSSDITASGGNPALSGTVTIKTPVVDPSKGLGELPVTVTDPSNQIVVGCAAARGNSFTVTGRGGLPEDPTAIIRGQTVWRDFQDYSQGTGVGKAAPQNPQALMGKPSPRLVEANSWVRDEKGNVVLVAVEGNATPSTYKSRPPDCQDLSALGAPKNLRKSLQH